MPSQASFDHAGAAALPRIVICAAGELFGGVERHVLGAAAALAARGAAVLPVLFHDAELARALRAQGAEPLVLPAANRATLQAVGRLAGLLARHRADVVHAHGYKAGVVCALARLRERFALVKTEHGLPEATAGRPAEALRGQLYARLDALAMRRAGATVCYVTEELRAHCRQAHAGLRTEVVPNGIEPLEPRHFARPPEYADDAFNLVVVGRLDSVKGQRVAIEALAAGPARAPWRLHLVGEGPDEAALRALAQARGVAGQVRFLGFRRNVYDYVAHGDLLLMPSLHEGLPYTLLEAMALATPVVASRTGGIAEVMRHDATALLVPPGDAAALARAVADLHDDPARRARLGTEARRLQAASFSLEAMVERYLGIYRRQAAPAVAADRPTTSS